VGADSKGSPPGEENHFVFAKNVSDDTIPEIHTVIASKVG